MKKMINLMLSLAVFSMLGVGCSGSSGSLVGTGAVASAQENFCTATYKFKKCAIAPTAIGVTETNFVKKCKLSTAIESGCKQTDFVSTQMRQTCLKTAGYFDGECKEIVSTSKQNKFNTCLNNASNKASANCGFAVSSVFHSFAPTVASSGS